MGRHLTDKEIQDYLERQGTTGMEEHVAHCAQCTAEVKQYRLLYGELEKPIPVQLSRDFSTAVLERTMPTTTGVLASGLWQIWLWILGLAGCFGAALYFIGVENIQRAYNTYTFDFSAFSKALTQILQFTETLGLNYGLLALGLLSLILLSLFDHFFLKARRLF